MTNTSQGGSLFINISYTDAEVTALGLNESLLRIWRQNNSNWTNESFAFGQYCVDTGANVVFANITNFSVFGVFGASAASAPTPTPSPRPGGGGGGKIPKPKKEVKEEEKLAELEALRKTSVEQPAVPQTTLTTPTETQAPEQREEQTQFQVLPMPVSEQSLATAAATQDQEVELIESTNPDAVLASLFYGLALVAIIGLAVYWYVLHHRRK